MRTEEHYLTYAVFFIRGKNYGEVPYCDVDYGELEGNAIIRKVCFCGSNISYDEDGMLWVCSTSGETVCPASKESLLVGHSYCEPLMPMTISTGCEPHLSELNHPEKDSHIFISEDMGQVHILIKIPKRKVWMISDPLPIANYFRTTSLGSDLVVEWILEIAFDLPGSIDMTIPLSVFNSAHKDCLRNVSSGAAVFVQFVDKEALSVIAQRRIVPNDSYLHIVRGALQLAERLPDNSEEREAVLADLREAKEWSTIEMASKFGFPECTEFLRFFLGKREFDNFNAHIQTCQLCQNFFQLSK